MDFRYPSYLRSSGPVWRSVMAIGKGRLLVGLLLAATIWGLVDVRRRAYPYPESPQEHKTDLTVYTGSGAAFFDGRPPYEVRNPRGWTYVYPPILALLLAPLAVLPMQDQATVWFFLCLWMCWGAYRECVRIVALVRGPTDDRPIGPARWIAWLGAIAVATVALPALNCLQRGQVSIPIVYLLLLGLRLILGGRTYRAAIVGGIVLSLPVAIKIVPILPIAVLLLVQLAGYLVSVTKGLGAMPTTSVGMAPLPRPPLGRQLAGSTVGVGLGLALFFFLLPAALIGWKANLRHLDTWNRLVLSSAGSSSATPGFENDTHSVRNQCLGNALYRLGNFGAYVFAGGPEDPMVDDDNPPPRMMDAPSVNRCLLAVRIALLLALMLVGLRLASYQGGADILEQGEADIPVCPKIADGPGRQERLPHLLLTLRVRFWRWLGLTRSVRSTTSPLLNQAAGFGLACGALLVVSPVARNHYFVLLGPAVLFVPLWLDRMGRHRAAAVLAIVPCVLVLLQYVLLPYVGRIGLLGLGNTAWLMAAMVLMDRASRSVPAVSAVQNAPDAHPTAALTEAA